MTFAFFDYFNIENWTDCIEKLDEGFDCCGVNWLPELNPPCFSGNYWWANSSYLKTLPRINNLNIQNLNRGEFWILSQTDKIYESGPNFTKDPYQNDVTNESDFSAGW
jgi:hypothetical protein